MAVTQGNGRSRAKSGSDRRQEIIEAAASIFMSKGYEATSIQDVADAVDILKGSLYYYIKSKDDLLYEVIQEVHLRGLENLDSQRGKSDGALKRLHTFVYRHIMFNASHLAKMTVFFHDFRSLSEPRREIIIEERDRYDTFVRELIAEGKDEGVIRDDVDPRLAAFSILGSVNWLYQWYREDGPRPIEEIADELATLAVNSVKAEGM
ncbi:MAG: TetR/AcrR family transcriptional regulator [bacterium]|nr:TetR/AcrR family transcriptional regulator [bacterium]